MHRSWTCALASLLLPGVLAAQESQGLPGGPRPPAAQARPADPAAEANAALARRFYDAFCRGDVATVERLYAPDVRFRDEIFSFDDRAGTMGMWRLLLAPEAGAKFTYELLASDAEGATVRWLADYRFPPPDGRPVHNVVTAKLVIRDGRIVDHHDSFSWEAWSRQAFPLGRVASWAPVAWTLKAGIRTVFAWQVRKAERARQKAEGRGMIERLDQAPAPR